MVAPAAGGTAGRPAAATAAQPTRTRSTHEHHPAAAARHWPSGLQRRDYLQPQFEALLGQTFEDLELIISDNASTDATEEICRDFAARDKRIRYFRQERNIGAFPNHTFVLDQSRSELFKFASHDDLYARDLIERCVAALDERPEVVLAHSWTAVIDDSYTVTPP